jgi:hypothetical protein
VKRLAPRPSSIRKAGRFEDGSEGRMMMRCPETGTKTTFFLLTLTYHTPRTIWIRVLEGMSTPNYDA